MTNVLHRIRGRGRLGLPTLALLLLAASVIACSGGDTEGAGAEASPAVAVDADLPRLIASGALVAPPYTVAVDGATVTVNNVPTVSFAAPPAPEITPVDESATLDAFGLVELARLAYLEAGGGDDGVRAVLAQVGARPDVGDIAANTRDGVIEIAITDRDGFTASLVPEPPDAAPRNATDGQRTAAAEETATTIRAHLEAGGGLVVSAGGTTILVAADRVEELLQETDAAMTLDGDARREALSALYDDDVIVEEIIEHYEPRADAARALPSTLPRGVPGGEREARPQLIAGAGHYLAPPLLDEQAGGLPAKTPASRKAWVFVTLYYTDSQGFIDALSKEGYEVRLYNFYNVAQPAGSAWEAFLRTSQSGAVYFATHSSANGIAIQSFAREADASEALGRLRTQHDAGDIAWWQEANGTWWLNVTPQGIRKNWKSAETIVHSASCHSITLAGSFAAREFFGYEPTTSCAIATPDTNRLWKRLTGEDGRGSLREASTAFGAGGFSAGFRHQDGSPGAGTVLSPAVTGTMPELPLIVGDQSFVLVRFDADMDTSVQPTLVLDVEGCASRIGDGQWPFANTITVPVQANEPGTATVRVHWRYTASERGRIALDGNQAPANSNGVAQNRDDYVFEFNCVTSFDLTATPITELPTETPVTATPAAASTQVTVGDGYIVVFDLSEPAREGYVRLEVLVHKGEHYPVIQFTVALPDACEKEHYHAASAVSLEGSTTLDPNRPACGFGTTDEVDLLVVDVPQAVIDALPPGVTGQ
ncbi:MAG: hypothetical protein AB7F65_09530 [Dehalococcoidia bacterium]